MGSRAVTQAGASRRLGTEGPSIRSTRKFVQSGQLIHRTPCSAGSVLGLPPNDVDGLRADRLN